MVNDGSSAFSRGSFGMTCSIRVARSNARHVVVLVDQRFELRQRLLARPPLLVALLQRPGQGTRERHERQCTRHRPPVAEQSSQDFARSSGNFSGLRVVRRGGRGCGDLVRCGARCEARVDRGDDLVADLVLERERVLEPAIVALGPDVLVLRRIDELRGHAHAVVDLAYAAFDDVLAAELARDRPRVDLAALVGGGGLPGHDLEARQRLQPRRQVLHDAVGEVLLRRIVAHVRERQHDDGAGLDAGRADRPRPKASRRGRGRCRSSRRAPARSGNPSSSRTVVKVIVQGGRFSAGRTTEATWTSSHPTTA